MIDVMNQAEDLESLDNLHALCTLMQTIREFSDSLWLNTSLTISICGAEVTMNDIGLYEHILEDDIFYGVIGMLECMDRQYSFPSSID